MAANSTYDTSVSNSKTNTIKYAINQSLLNVNTILPCEIMAINGNRYTIQILTNYIDSTGKPSDAPTIYNVPYAVIQGGNAGVIITPIVGDAVAVGFSQRDISIVKQNWKKSNPGSFRKFSVSDAIILGTLTNTPPTINITINQDGIVINAPSLPVQMNCQTAEINADQSATINTPRVIIGGASTAIVGGNFQILNASMPSVQGGNGATSNIIVSA